MNDPGSTDDARPLADSLTVIATCAGLSAMFLYRMGPNVADPDLWHEMALAREAKGLGSIPWHDHFAYTPTLYPVVHHEWGAGVIALTLARTLGGTGIVLARYILAALLAAITLATARRRGATLPVLAFLTPLAILLVDEGFSAIRAQMYSFLFFALLLWFLEEDARGSRWWIAAFAPMVVLWANVHAGILAGAGILATTWAERLLRGERHAHLILAGLAMAALLAVNPYGWHYYAYVARASTMPRPDIDEWLPLWKEGDATDLAIFAGTLAIAVYAIAWIGPREARGILPLAVTAVVGAQRSRLVDFYAIIWLAYVPGWVRATPLGESMAAMFRRRGGLMAAFWGATAVLLLAQTGGLHPWELRVPAGSSPVPGKHLDYPVGAAEYLRSVGFQGNVMTPFDWGAYISWKLYPAVKVSMDGRYEVAYPDAVADASFRLYKGEPGWEGLLKADHADIVLVHNQLPLARLMPGVAGWHRVYRDRTFALFARSGLALPQVDRSDPVADGTFP
jgi:hypothetical protein